MGYKEDEMGRVARASPWVALLVSSACARPPAPDRSASAATPAPSSTSRPDAADAPAVADGEAPYHPPLSFYGTEADNLAKGRDATLQPGERLVALQMYARNAREAGHGADAARNIFALRGQITTLVGDAMYDAIGLTGSPAAIPLLLGTGDLRGCEGADMPAPRTTVDALADRDATVVLDLNAAFTTIAVVAGLVEAEPDSPEAAAAVPDFVQALRCGDERIRFMAGQSVGNVHSLRPPDVAALRDLLRHPRVNTRALAASLLVLASSPDDVTVSALERALLDPHEEVQLSAANALLRQGHPIKALPVVRRLSASKSVDIASAAAKVLSASGQPAP
jgi:hypothetical protein